MKKKKTILLVEDERVLAEMYQDRLIKEGFEVFLAFDSEGALKLLKKKEKKPDLILLDILLPEENGVFFLEELRKNKDTASLLVVAFSNYDDPEIKKKTIELGAKEYLIKANYTPSEIVAKIKEYLD